MNNVIKIERWKPIWFTHCKYQVSCFGKVKSVYTISKMGVIRFTGTILKTTINHRGYEKVKLQWFNTEGKSIKKTMSVHRLVCAAFNLNLLNKPEVNHKDLNQLNNHFRNLEWATSKENANHAQLNGARPTAKPKIKKGFNYDAKYNHKVIVDINTGVFYESKELADLLGTTRKQICRILAEERNPNTTQYRYA